jgi:hypothetical protein
LEFEDEKLSFNEKEKLENYQIDKLTNSFCEAFLEAFKEKLENSIGSSVTHKLINELISTRRILRIIDLADFVLLKKYQLLNF